MTLGFAHELGMALAALSALGIVLLGGELPVVAWLALGAPLVSALLRSRGRSAPASAGTLLALASVALGFAQIAVNGIEFAVLGGGLALVGLLSARLLTRETSAHDVQAILLSLLLVFAGSVLNVGLSFAPMFILFAVSAVWALTTRQLLRGSSDDVEDAVVSEALRSRTDVVTPTFFLVSGGISLLILLGTGVVFVAFPRVGLANFGVSSQRSGQFPSSVTLRGNPRAAVGTGAVVARVSGVPTSAFNEGLYLRGGVYDVITTSGFERSSSMPRPTARYHRLAPGPVEGSYEVYLNPVGEDLLLSLGAVRGAQALAGGLTNPNVKIPIGGFNAHGELSASRRVVSPIRYRIQGEISAPGYVDRALADVGDVEDDALLPYLVLPEGLDPRVIALADTLAGEATRPDVIAARFREHLLDTFTYTLDQPAGSADEPLVAFLFEHRSGHCEYFATAFAMLLRLKGIPARVVGGYQGGLWDDEDALVVFTGQNAHAWVEWYAPEVGWVVDDATPAPSAPREQLEGARALMDRIRRFWDDQVLDYALEEQMSALRKTRSAFAQLAETGDVKGALVYVVGGVAVVGLVVLVRRLRGRRRHDDDEGDRLAAGIASAIERLQRAPLSDVLTFREAEARLADVPSALREATSAYERQRFGGLAIDDRELEVLLGRLAEIEAPVTAGEGPAIEGGS